MAVNQQLPSTSHYSAPLLSRLSINRSLVPTRRHQQPEATALCKADGKNCQMIASNATMLRA